MVEPSASKDVELVDRPTNGTRDGNDCFDFVGGLKIRSVEPVLKNRCATQWTRSRTKSW